MEQSSQLPIWFLICWIVLTPKIPASKSGLQITVEPMFYEAPKDQIFLT